MGKQIALHHQTVAGAERLARAVDRIARSDGDHATAVSSLSLHRRSTPTEPLHCVYGLGLGVIAQGSKHYWETRSSPTAPDNPC